MVKHNWISFLTSDSIVVTKNIYTTFQMFGVGRIKKNNVFVHLIDKKYSKKTNIYNI